MRSVLASHIRRNEDDEDAEGSRSIAGTENATPSVFEGPRPQAHLTASLRKEEENNTAKRGNDKALQVHLTASLRREEKRREKQHCQTWMKRLGNPGTCNSIVEEGGTVIMMMIKENYAVNDDDEDDDGDKRR